MNASLSQDQSPQSGTEAPLQTRAPAAPSCCLKQRAHHPSPPGLGPGPSSPSVNVREDQNEKSQMGRQQWTLEARLQRRLSGQVHPGWNSLPYLPLGWPRLCPSLLLATVAIRHVLSSQVSHASPSGKARHQEPREWTSTLGTSVTSASFLTQGNRLGPLPGTAGTQPQLSLPHQCFSW